MENLTYNFVNAVASLKDGITPLDEMKLRATRVFAKLMLNKGCKFDPTSTSLSQFIQSTNSAHIRAELFIVGKSGQIITDSRVFVNVQKESIKIHQGPTFWFVELIHPSIKISECPIVEFGA